VNLETYLGAARVFSLTMDFLTFSMERLFTVTAILYATTSSILPRGEPGSTPGVLPPS